MSPPRAQRSQPCGEADARTRLAHARKMLEVADLVHDSEREIAESAMTAAALAVLAGIAASDAACCAALGRRSRSADHRDAITVLSQITPGGDAAAQKLRRILDEKDNAHYGLHSIGGQTLNALMRQAAGLVEFADDVIAR